MISWPELLILAAIVLVTGIALVRVARSDESGGRKVCWTVLIVMFPGLGGLAYLLTSLRSPRG